MKFPTDHDLQAQMQRWRLHLQQTPLAVIEWDMEGRVRSWNPAAEGMFGYSAEEALGQPIIELIIPPEADLRSRVHGIADGLTQDRKASRVEHENRRKDGSIILCRWFNTPLTDEAGSPLGVASMALDVTEIHEATEALRRSELRFRAVADHTHAWEFWIGGEGQLVWMSPSCEQTTGYPVEAFQKDPGLIFRICHPEDRPRVVDHFREAAAGPCHAPMEFRIQHRDGHQVWIHHLCEPVRDNEGRPAGRRATNQDITSRKQYELELQESEQRFRTIFEKAIDGIIIFSLEGRLLDLNEAFARMHGWTREEMLGRDIRDLNTADTNALVPGRLRRLMTGETLKVELNQIHREGYVFHTEATACLISYGGQPAILSFHRDITERKRAEAAAARAAMEWNAAMDASSDVVYLLDLDRRILRANRAFFRATGTTPESAIGCPITRILHPRGELAPCPVCRAQEERRDFRMVMEADHPDNPVHLPLEIFLKVVKDEADHPVSLLMTLRDLTPARKDMEERAALERQLQQAQKMESLGTLAGGIAHDMNNVLGAILGLASAHVERLPPEHPDHRAFETIAKAATRGGDMVRSLLSFARREQVETKELDLNAILREEARLLERTTLSRVRLVLDLAPDLHPVRGDGNALAHAVMNLCVNAVDAMPDQGTLTLATRNAEDGWVEACVQDTGSGMTREVLERAMEPFFTTKGTGKGTGLGLAMVYSTMKAHQGRVEILSAPGQGTTVHLRLPACATHDPEPSPLPESLPPGPLRPLNVLVVDDDDLIREATETLLRSAGHIPSSVASGEEALARLESGLRPDVVVLDLNMPGLGGSGTLPRIRLLAPEVPILLATGRADQAALDLVERHGCAGLLPKPFTLQELRRRLELIQAPVP